MWKHWKIFISIFFFNRFILISNFLLSNENKLILVPSVAFRYHSNQSNIDDAQFHDDWILYVQGFLFIYIKITENSTY